jgi:hypothetical protein
MTITEMLAHSRSRRHPREVSGNLERGRMKLYVYPVKGRDARRRRRRRALRLDGSSVKRSTRITGKIITVADVGASPFLLLRRARRVRTGKPITDPMSFVPRRA